MLGTVLSGCGSKNGSNEKGEKLSIVTTIFPEYDWVREITNGNENVEITMLLDNGVDLHSFQPTADDIVKISSCDMFIYVGGESDEWVEDVLADAKNKDMVVVNLLEVLGGAVKEEEVIEGMQEEEHHHDDDDDNHEHEDGDEYHEDEEHDHEDGEVEYDEHVWLSLRNAQVLCQYIADELGKADADNKATYEANVKTYVDKLTALDTEYKTVCNAANTKTVLFGDRFPFRYLVDDYGLDYYAAFVGCSAESEASFETITFLAGKVDELGLHTILQIESADGKIAETIKNASKSKNQEILTMDSMQSVTAKDVSIGASYLSIMEKNLEALKKALQ